MRTALHGYSDKKWKREKKSLIHLVKLLEAEGKSALTEATTADVHAVLVDDTMNVATHTAASTILTLTLVVGVAVIKSSVTHRD